MKILIATDGSDFSKAAVETSCNMVVRPDDTAIKIVSVFEAPAPTAAEPFAVSADYYRQLAEIAEKRAENSVEYANAFIQERFPDIKIDLSNQVELGRPAEVIVETAKDWNADLIVVGSHGHGFWGRAMLGSVSDAVVHHAPCSVLVARGLQPKERLSAA